MNEILKLILIEIKEFQTMYTKFIRKTIYYIQLRFLMHSLGVSFSFYALFDIK